MRIAVSHYQPEFSFSYFAVPSIDGTQRLKQSFGLESRFMRFPRIDMHMLVCPSHTAFMDYSTGEVNTNLTRRKEDISPKSL